MKKFLTNLNPLGKSVSIIFSSLSYKIKVSSSAKDTFVFVKSWFQERVNENDEFKGILRFDSNFPQYFTRAMLTGDLISTI